MGTISRFEEGITGENDGSEVVDPSMKSTATSNSAVTPSICRLGWSGQRVRAYMMPLSGGEGL